MITFTKTSAPIGEFSYCAFYENTVPSESGNIGLISLSAFADQYLVNCIFQHNDLHLTKQSTSSSLYLVNCTYDRDTQYIFIGNVFLVNCTVSNETTYPPKWPTQPVYPILQKPTYAFPRIYKQSYRIWNFMGFNYAAF